MYIQQDSQNFSKQLINEFLGKRPDFMILVPYFGLMMVDVKYKNINTTYNTYPIDINEIKKYSMLQRKFNFPIWFVISNENLGFGTWLWIPVSKVLELGVSAKTSSISQEGFLPVHNEEFIKLSESDSLSRLFEKLFEGR
jgi:hypothetical protein